MDSKSGLGSETLYIIASHMSGAALRAGVYIFVGRRLGASALGTLIFSFAIIEFVHSLTLFGFDRAMIRFGPPALETQKPRQFLRVLALCLTIPVAISIIVSAVSYTVLSFMPDEDVENGTRELLTIGVLILPLMAVVMVAANALRASGNVRLYALIMPLSPLLWLCFTVVILENGSSLLSVFIGYGAALSITVAATLFVLWCTLSGDERYGPINAAFADQARLVTQYAMIVATSGFSLLLISKLDRFLLGVLGSIGETGRYGAAVSMAGFVGFLAAAVGLAIAPRISALHHNNDMNGITKMYEHSVQATIILALPVACVLFFEPSFFMALFGKDFQGVDLVLHLLVLGFLGRAVVGPAGYVLVQIGRERWELANVGFTAMLLGMLCYAWIPSYGALGAASAVLLSLLVLSVLRVVEVRAVLGVWGLTARALIPLTCFSITVAIYFLWKEIQEGGAPMRLSVVPLSLICINVVVSWCCRPYAVFSLKRQMG